MNTKLEPIGRTREAGKVGYIRSVRHENMRTTITSVVIATAVVGCGMSNGDLSRSKAAELVKAALSEKSLSRFDSCVGSDALHQELDARGYIANWPFRLTESGSAFLELDQWYSILLKNPATLQLVEIMGIAEVSPTLRQVEFEWRYVGVPEEVASLHSAGGPGTASVVKYDDGWRIEELNKDVNINNPCIQPAK